MRISIIFFEKEKITKINYFIKIFLSRNIYVILVNISEVRKATIGNVT